MKVKVENIGPSRKLMKLEIPPEQVSAEWDRLLTEYTRFARVDGFRKGKAPSDVVARHYGRDLAADAGERLMSKAYREALEQQKIKPLTVVDVKHDDLVRDRLFSVSITLDVHPEFKLPKYKGLALRKNKIEISDEAVEERVKKILEEMAEYEPSADQPSQAGDMVQIDFTAFMNDVPLAEAVPEARHIAAAKDMWWPVKVGMNLIPGLDEALLDVTAGRDLNVPITFDSEFKIAALSGKSAEYRVAVKAVRKRKVPALDAAFLERIKMESEAAFRDHVRKILQGDAEGVEDERLREQIFNILLAKTTVDVPESAVAGEAQAVFRRMIRSRMLSGTTEAQLKEESEELVKNANEQAAKMVKLNYILQRIADEEKIEVTEDELNDRIKYLAYRSEIAEDEFRKLLKEKDEEDAVREDVRTNKAVDLVLEQAEIQTEGFLGRLISGVTGRKETT